MTLKATWLWNGTAANGNLLFGFSETWYTDDAPAVVFDKMFDIAEVRAELLPKTVRLFGIRMADVAPGSRSFTLPPRKSVNGQGRDSVVNVAQDALLCRVFGTTGGTIKRFWMHALQDTMVNDGQIVEGLGVTNAARRHLNELAAGGFKFRHIVANASSSDILSIDATGNVVLLAAIGGLAVNAKVQLLHVRGVDGRGKRGIYAVETITDALHIKLAHWPGDAVGRSGKLRIVQYGFTSLVPIPNAGFGSNAIIRVGVRKCGRPFGQLRGRVAARR